MELFPRDLNLPPSPLLPTLHKHLYLWNDYCTKDYSIPSNYVDGIYDLCILLQSEREVFGGISLVFEYF